jgi:drug/metabolite transporter (DMT)-like permease
MSLNRATVPRALPTLVALAAVYILWGSTSPAIKIGVGSLHPAWFIGLRFVIAGSALWIWCRARGRPLPTVAHVRGAALTGVILLVFGNALFAWTLQYLPSGIGGLFFALSPLWMALFGFALYRERISPVAGFGLALGLGGMIYLYSPSGAQHLPLVPTLLGVLTSVTWAFGSMIQRRFRAADVVQMSALQMLIAGGLLVCIALASGAPLSRAEFTPAAIGALAYLVVLGSIVGFSAYLWLMNNVPTTLGSTYAYVNPVVSLAIGIGLLHEPFSRQLAFGAATIVAGVAIMLAAPLVTPGRWRTFGRGLGAATEGRSSDG